LRLRVTARSRNLRYCPAKCGFFLLTPLGYATSCEVLRAFAVPDSVPRCRGELPRQQRLGCNVQQALSGSVPMPPLGNAPSRCRRYTTGRSRSIPFPWSFAGSGTTIPGASSLSFGKDPSICHTHASPVDAFSLRQALACPPSVGTQGEMSHNSDVENRARRLAIPVRTIARRGLRYRRHPSSGRWLACWR